ncbi:TIGR02206 family membrane protein [Virgibacillus sp. C22-A2]|uniref:TIGR02206 family membrane protein n=1 Tax=Virgibacillus tibetensis TaxID=3042313 RepID=A0ABU6KKT9_9BACI|nr:TIGR02206 family membrane protein [Virgibacillus sp. C22-A2]
MEEWFGKISNEHFIPFSFSHIAMILIYIVALVILLITYKKYAESDLLLNVFRWSIIVTLTLSELSYQTWSVVNGSWSAGESLPLHLCSIAGIIVIIGLATYNKKIITISFFIGFLPALLAIVTPELTYNYTHFRFWHFFIHHIVLSFASIFLLLSSSVKITVKYTLEAYGYLLIYAAIIGFLINPTLNSNYLFLSNTPTADTLFDVLGDGIWYYINLCLLGLVVFIGQFGVLKLFIYKEK